VILFVLGLISSLSFAPPQGWVSVPVQHPRLASGWVILEKYVTPAPNDVEAIELDRGPLIGLDIADYAYLEVETIKRDAPDVAFDTDREQRMCSGDMGWLLRYRFAANAESHTFDEVLFIKDAHAYRVVDQHTAPDTPSVAIAALTTNCGHPLPK
jgi:hypothetical protein